ncbi:MAG: hypothetical protein LH477_12665 [Nocardioides sp.]|nr:hypothetical protein [Nocardioides sp.]
MTRLHPALLRHRRSRLPSWHLSILLVAVVIQGGVALWLGSRGWFSGDVLHYYVERGGAPGGTEGLMEPHAAHWQLVLVVVYLVVFKLVGLTTYVPFIALTVAVHLVLVLVMYRLLGRLGASLGASLLCALALLTYGAGSEAFIVEAPVALTGSLLLGAIAVTQLVGRDFDLRSQRIASVLLLISVMVSLGGVVASVWVGVFAASRGLGRMVRIVAPPAVAFVAWFVIWGRGDTRVSLEPSEVMQVPEAAWALLVAPLDNITAGWGAGPFLLLLVIVVSVWRAEVRPVLAAATWAGLVAAMFHATVSAIAQVPYGLDQVLTSRYRYVVLVLLLPGLALVLDAFLARASQSLSTYQRRLVLVPGTIVIGSLLLHAALGQYRVASAVADIGELTRDLLAGTVVATSTGEKVINDSVRGSYISGEDLERLSSPELRDELPQLPLTEENRIEAESQYFVEVAAADNELGEPASLTSDSFVPRLQMTSGCRTYTATNATPTLTLTSFVGAGIRVRTDAGSVTTRLYRPAEDIRGSLVSWIVNPEEWVQISTSAQLASLDVTFDSGGSFTICPG